MAIQYSDPQAGEDALIAQINTTPLVDVMLVLLIIFLITIPVVNSSIAVTLPREQNQRVDAQQENVIVTVDAQGAVYWFDTPLPDRAALVQLLQKIAAMQPQPEVHIRSDVRADYAPVGGVVLAAQQAGIARIGFLTEPPER
ncbi:ExbD/TolR family protein [Ramlibacter sp. AN1133]|uniref:ExbD/TolR family protein n=1 Tax=Ramlibacter sp. AN1133 TaxID=3133429 RepID=UPI0030BBF5DD